MLCGNIHVDGNRLSCPEKQKEIRKRDARERLEKVEKKNKK
jgi:hypothetical protein